MEEALGTYGPWVVSVVSLVAAVVTLVRSHGGKVIDTALALKSRRAEGELKQEEAEQYQIGLALNNAIGTNERLIAENSTINEDIRKGFTGRQEQLENRVKELFTAQDTTQRYVLSFEGILQEWMREFERYTQERDQVLTSRLQAQERELGHLRQAVASMARVLNQKVISDE